MAVLRPRASAIIAKRQILRLESRLRALSGRVASVNGNQARCVLTAEPAGILRIDDGTASEDHSPVLFLQRDRQLRPMQKILADRVSPTHVAPFISERVVLEKEVILAFEVNEPVGVVGPMLARREMVLRTKRLIKRFLVISAYAGRHC